MICRLDEGRKVVEPCSIIIFGASGDLTARKLIPALYHLCKNQQMPADFRVVGLARREKTDASWRGELRSALDRYSRTQPVDEQVWQDFSQRLCYCRATSAPPRLMNRWRRGWRPLAARRCAGTCSFILQPRPASSARWWNRCNEPGCSRKTGARAGNGSWWKSRLPRFGLRATVEPELARYAREQQVFRIDHYLGRRRCRTF